MLSLSDRSARAPAAWRSKRLSPLDCYWTSIGARFRHHALSHNLVYDDPSAALHDLKGHEQYELIEVLFTKAAQQPAAMSVSGWAAELVSVTVAEFVQSLTASIFGQLAAQTLGLTFGGAGQVRVPTRDTAVRINGSFIGEGSPIPCRRTNFVPITLTPRKVGVVSEFTRELAKQSPQSVESILRMVITEDTGAALDAVLLDTTAGDAIRPPGLGLGAVAVTAAPAGTNAMLLDARSLTAAVQPADRVGIIANPAQSISLTPLYVNQEPLVIMSSSNVPAGTLFAVDLSSFVHAADLPKYDTTEQAVLHEESDLPLPISTVGAPATISAPDRSLWQTNTVALRMIMPVTWVLRRASGSVAKLTGAAW